MGEKTEVKIIPSWELPWWSHGFSITGDMGLIPVWGTEIPLGVWYDQKKKKVRWDSPGGPVDKNPYPLATQGTWVQSLVKELRSHMPQSN